jgi:hypothetical protein
MQLPKINKAKINLLSNGNSELINSEKQKLDLLQSKYPRSKKQSLPHCQAAVAPTGKLAIYRHMHSLK